MNLKSIFSITYGDRMNIWEDMDSMRRELNRMFPFSEKDIPFDYTQPAIDMIDKGNEILVVADLPGMKKEDVHVKCTERYLDISAKSSEKKEEKKEGYYYAERSASSYSRRIPLPVAVIPKDVKSTFKDGTLEVRLPKREKTETNQGFEVKVE